MIEHFQIKGPNEVHLCLVFEPMGPSTASMLDELPCNRPHNRNKPSRYPKAMVKKIIMETLSALAFLHKHHLTHGDIQPENILFSITDLSSVEEEQLRQDQDTISDPLRRLDRKTHLWAPKYLALGQPLYAFVKPESSAPTVKLADLGAAFWTALPPESAVTPLGLRAPELIFRDKFDSSIDIWALGCLLYEFLTGTPLFLVDLLGCDEQDEVDDDHILEFVEILGPLPERLIARWHRQDRCIGPQGERLQPSDKEDDATDSEEDGLPAQTFVNKPLEELFSSNKADDVDEQEAEIITTLIREILQYDSAQRPTAEQLLQHSWVQS